MKFDKSTTLEMTFKYCKHLKGGQPTGKIYSRFISGVDLYRVLEGSSLLLFMIWVLKVVKWWFYIFVAEEV